ncbi:NAD(P)-binding protein [Hypoxylon fragiforme]|uniref:NAD(P)-binding protein n=1 Tax=Hypoxylon fragiforme TaxID=63214 RepID=UPI0020C65791|nr:NAD(P)-binding protein [Hypoxylon fragiforme]KAI2614336.1 NAD(P)-binding protein [Hypoxylon fragiforme]
MPQALFVKKVDGKPGEVYYPLQLNSVPKPKPGPDELLIQLHAAALNHRDFFIRQHLYPGISFTHPLLADGSGTVVEIGNPTTNSPSSSSSSSYLGKRVILYPASGWSSSPSAPEDPSKFTTLGAAALSPIGTAQDYVAVPASQIELAPPHLSPAEAAALPLVGLTAWRALVTKALDGDVSRAVAGRNILVTGIGGGVALCALQFGVALGCNVFVTSSSASKLSRAVTSLGAKGGVSYRDSDWDKQLAAQLPRDRPYLDAVIDGAGGDIIAKTVRLVRHGGVVVVYGMTVSPRMDWLMSAVMRNIELRGTTMGSRDEFRDMVAFVREHRIRPVVSRVVKGLDNIEGIDGLFEDMRDGKQFGKLVIEISSPPDEEGGAKL